jgi:hypothetical protein
VWLGGGELGDVQLGGPVVVVIADNGAVCRAEVAHQLDVTGSSSDGGCRWEGVDS